MKRISEGILVAALFFFMACGSTPLKPAGADVRVVLADPIGCKELGMVHGFDMWATAPDREGPLNAVRNDAAELGADQIVVDHFRGAHLYAIAYRCGGSVETRGQ